MNEERLDRRVAAARTDLERQLAPRAPDLEVARGRARWRHRTLAAAAAMVLLASVVVVAVQPEPEASVVAGRPSGVNAGVLAPGEARRLAAAPLSGRSTIASVWTGTEMLLWGGEGPNGPTDDGAAYSPAADSWRMLPAGPLSARNAPAAVWTGKEMLLWGGHVSGDARVDGAAFDPAMGRWRSIAEAPVRSAGRPVAVWTGSEMLVLAGVNSHDAAAYDPAADAWRQLPDLPGQLQAPTPAVAWTGSQIAAVLSYPGAGPATPGGAGSGVFVLAPRAETWTELPRLGAGQVRLAWTGKSLLAVTNGVAAVLDEAAKQWTGVAEAPEDTMLGDPVTIWTGTEMLLWSGTDATLIDPARRTWRTMPAGGLDQRVQPAAVWADGVFVAWGGFPDRADGIVLRPSVSQGAPSGPVPVPTPVEPSQAAVPVAGPDGRIRGTIVPGSPPAVWNGRTLRVLPVRDARGELAGYFGCRFLERNEVERDDFDADASCPVATAVVGRD